MTNPARPFRFAAAIAAVAAMALVLTGCASGAEAPAAATGETRTITGTINGDVEVPVAPKRVVALWNVGYQLDELGVVPVGVLEDSYTESDLTPEKWTELSAIPTVGSFDDLDIEAIIDLEPDVIVSMDNGTEWDYDELNAIAPTVSFSVTSPSDVWTNYKSVADAVDKADEYAALAGDLDDSLAAVKAEFGDEVAGVQSVYVDAYQEGSAYVYTSTGLAADRIQAAGFDYDLSWDDKAEWYGYDLDFELLSDLSGEKAIFYSADLKGEPADEFTAALLDEPAFSALPAVQAGNLFPYRGVFVYTYASAQLQVEDIAAAARAYKPVG